MKILCMCTFKNCSLRLNNKIWFKFFVISFRRKYGEKVYFWRELYFVCPWYLVIPLDRSLNFEEGTYVATDRTADVHLIFLKLTIQSVLLKVH
jgi:hypothetical protein